MSKALIIKAQNQRNQKIKKINGSFCREDDE